MENNLEHIIATNIDYACLGCELLEYRNGGKTDDCRDVYDGDCKKCLADSLVWLGEEFKGYED